MHDVHKQNVLIVGTYSGLNKGDRLMQCIIINALNEINMIPILSTPFPEIDNKIYKNVQIVKCCRRNLITSIIQIIILGILPFALRAKFALNNRELRDYVDAKFIIDSSGDMHTEDYGIHVAVSHLVPLCYCFLLRKKFIVLAQSIGPFKHLKLLYKKILSEAYKITARDKITFDYLKGLGLDNVLEVADLGFQLKPTPIEHSYLSQLKKNKHKLIIGICPSALFFNKFAKSNPNVNFENFCQTLESIAKEHNISYLILPHVLTPSGKVDDAQFSQKLCENLHAESLMVDAELSPSEIKYIISDLDAVVSFRMHGAIAALDCFVPTIAISYSHKTTGLFEKIGLGQWVISNDSDMLINLKNNMNLLLSTSAEIVDHLKNVIPDVRRESEKNILLIKRMAS